ncbi:MAG: alpha/beta fold hydrolase [Lachnospiraceae bacterium]|nr:alpha/beta fold hydrolase [Lachnospiraceae bacterium]
MDGKQLLKQLDKRAEIYGSSQQMDDQTISRLDAVYQKDNPLGLPDAELYAVKERLLEQLMVDTYSADQLREKYPGLVQQAEYDMGRLKNTASLSGVKKLEEDTFGTRKRAAQKQLDQIHSKQEQLYEARFGKKLEVKKRSGLLNSLVHRLFNSTETDRRDMDPRHKAGDYSTISWSHLKDKYGKVDAIHGDMCWSEVSFPLRSKTGEEKAKLKGKCFTPKGFDLQSGKIVICYTGSGEPGQKEYGVGTAIQEYLRQGFKVYQVDYRGYGDSGPEGSYSLSEAGFYEDGECIYQFVLEENHCSPSQILLHGYSMGAAVASYVAAHVAQQDSEGHKEGDQTAQAKIGGLILDSPMASMSKAARGMTHLGGVGEALGSIAGMASGDYSTEEHLGVLFKNQPDIPILFVSGDSSDHLSLDRTGIFDKYAFASKMRPKSEEADALGKKVRERRKDESSPEFDHFCEHLPEETFERFVSSKLGMTVKHPAAPAPGVE